MFNEQLKPYDTIGLKAGQNISEQLDTPRYHFRGVLRDADGNIIDVQEVTNQVQTLMKTHIADALADQGEAQMGWMAIGTGTGQGVGDATLATELDRQALDGGTPTHASAVVTYHRTFAAGEGTGTVTEACVINAGA